MTTKAIYCSKCRDGSGHLIARGKIGPDVFRKVTVTGRNNNGSYSCKCECGHSWSSRSPEAAALFRQDRP